VLCLSIDPHYKAFNGIDVQFILSKHICACACTCAGNMCRDPFCKDSRLFPLL
jgi:hypothetical protein